MLEFSQLWHLKVNHSVNKTTGAVIPHVTVEKKRLREPYIVVLAMSIYTVLQYGKVTGEASLGMIFLVSSLSYFLAIFLYYGIAYLAYQNRTYLLWGGGALAFIVGYFMSGLTGVWSLLTGWSMILFAGTIVGRLTLSRQNRQKIYIISVLTVVVFAVGQFFPLWNDLMNAATQGSESMLEEARQNLVSAGYGADAVEKNLDSARKSLHMLIRLIPALTIMSVVMQFSIGYLVFAYWIDRKGYQDKRLTPFVYWKVPFGVMPALIMAILARISGYDALVHIADNTIAILALFYAVTGLALVEFYLRRFKLSKLMKVLFYIMLSFTQLIGFFVTVLLGFIDSFVDWRKIHQLNSVKE